MSNSKTPLVFSGGIIVGMLVVIGLSFTDSYQDWRRKQAAKPFHVAAGDPWCQDGLMKTVTPGPCPAPVPQVENVPVTRYRGGPYTDTPQGRTARYVYDNRCIMSGVFPSHEEWDKVIGNAYKTKGAKWYDCPNGAWITILDEQEQP